MKKIIIIILLIGLIMGIDIYLNSDNRDNTNYNKVILEGIDNEDIDNEFLLWIKNNYGDKAINYLYNGINTYSDDVWYMATGNSLNSLFSLYRNEERVIVSDKTKLTFVGDISLADNFEIMPMYDKRGIGVKGILDEGILGIFKDSVTVVNNEFTVSNRGYPLDKLYTFRASEARLGIYDEMGVDLVTLANNHVYDYGEDAFNDMLDSLDKYNMPYIGAGRNINEAKRAFYYIVNGYKIAFLNATRAEKNIKTPEATDTDGGVFRCYDPKGLVNEIKEVRKNSDYVIVLVHYGKEDSTELEEEQINSSHEYVDVGADIVIGTHAHVLQGMELYNDKLIMYNLGDFIFNDEDKDTGIFEVMVLDKGLGYSFIPAHQKDEYTYLVNGSDKERVINKINGLSKGVKIDSDLGIVKLEM